MGVVQVQRAIKRGNVRTFDEEYNRGYTDIWASEVDADFDLLFDMWNASFQGLGDAIISPLPPLDPSIGDLWWRPTDGNLFVFYDDGNSKQFVPAVSTGKFLGTGLPNGVVPAGGDLTGNYPAPIIAPLKVTTPKIADGAITDVKVHDIAWAKLTGVPPAFPPTGPAGGALSGTYPDPGVVYNRITGIPAALPPTGPAGGALTGTYPNPGVDYTKLSNIPAPPTIPGSLPPTGPAGGDLAGPGGSTYPNPTLRLGAATRTLVASALSTPFTLTTAEQWVMEFQWLWKGNRWMGWAAIHGHIGLPVTGPATGVTSYMRLGGGSQTLAGAPISNMSFTNAVSLPGQVIVPFSIFHPLAGSSGTAGLQLVKMTAWVTGQLVQTAVIDTAWIMIFEPA